MSKSGAAEALSNLLDITRTLLGPGGCPWDRSQQPEDVKSGLVEEAYELMEAMDREDPEAIEEELGDLLYQVVFLTELYRDTYEISLATVLETLSEKLVRRHPHVFEEASAETSQEGVSQWEKAKRRERQDESPPDESVVLSGVPDHLPALLRSFRLTQKAATAGFDWNRTTGALNKVKEELLELEEELEQDKGDGTVREYGDFLFACANLARKLDLDPEVALQNGNDKFVKRFERMEERLRKQGRDIEEADRSELLSLWNEVRQREGEDGAGD